ncbi:MAG: hypothetical protein IPK50_22605 [Fibrobacterota bacterium]|nr:MAG: hypothetical protein IPK50_22605 [Fibrobacterota bacterium]
MSTRKVTPPPPDADLSPFEVGAYLAGHVPEYSVTTLQIGGKSQAERIESHRRYSTPEGFAAWLETEDAKRTDVEPIQTVECPGMTGALTFDQSAEAWGEVGKPPEIQAVHLEKVKTLRKAEAERAKEMKGAKQGGSNRSAPMADRAQAAADAWWRRNAKLSIREVAEKLGNGEKADGRRVAPGLFGKFETIRKGIKKPISG